MRGEGVKYYYFFLHKVVEEAAEQPCPTMVMGVVVAAVFFDLCELVVDSRCLCQNVLNSLEEHR